MIEIPESMMSKEFILSGGIYGNQMNIETVQN